MLPGWTFCLRLCGHAYRPTGNYQVASIAIHRVQDGVSWIRSVAICTLTREKSSCGAVMGPIEDVAGRLPKAVVDRLPQTITGQRTGDAPTVRFVRGLWRISSDKRVNEETKRNSPICHGFAQFHPIVTRQAPTADCENLETLVAQPPSGHRGDRLETTRIKKVSYPAVDRSPFTSHFAFSSSSR